MLLLLLNYVVLRALWKIDVHLISTLVIKVTHLSKGSRHPGLSVTINGNPVITCGC